MQPAIARWFIEHRVFIFYGNGGVFEGPVFERWFKAVEAANDLRLYVGGAGPTFTFGAAERDRGNALFKRKQLRFAVVTDHVTHRLLGTTARLIGVNLGLYGWSQSRRPFAELGDKDTPVDVLHQALLRLRREVDRELELLHKPAEPR